MLLGASRLLLLVPALTFGLGAAFILSTWRLGSAPADPAAWQVFLTLAPIIREPVYLVSGLSGLSDVAVLAVFSFAAALGCVLAALPMRTGRSAFIYAHLAFLTLFYAMGEAGVFTAGIGTAGLHSGVRWSTDFSAFPVAGIMLFCLLLASCAAVHLGVVLYMRKRAAASRDARDRLLAALEQFG